MKVEESTQNTVEVTTVLLDFSTSSSAPTIRKKVKINFIFAENVSTTTGKQVYNCSSSLTLDCLLNKDRPSLKSQMSFQNSSSRMDCYPVQTWNPRVLRSFTVSFAGCVCLHLGQ